MAHMHPQPSKPSCACIVDQPQTKGSELQRARSAQIFGQHEVHLDQVQQSSKCHVMPCLHWSALCSCAARENATMRMATWTDGSDERLGESTSRARVLERLGRF